MSKYLIIISIDALNAKDRSIFKHLPIFQDFIENGAYFPAVSSIYPSITYPCHTSIITGTYPEEHGIYNNEIPDPSKSPKHDWYWYEKDIQVPTLFDVAYSAGLTSAAVCYPVMAGSKSITYNFPEIWSNHGESQLSLFWKYGTLNILWDALKNAKKAKGKEQPYLDNFSTALFLDILRKKKPRLAALHLTELDTARHHHGIFSHQAKEALISAANHVEEIIWLTKEIGIYEETTFVLLGDHGFQDYATAISFNRLLVDMELIDIDERGTITDWKVYGASSDGSLQIHLSNPEDSKLQTKVELLIQSLMEHPENPIKACFTRQEVKEKYHLDGPFSYMLEANDGFAFVQEIHKNFLTPICDIKDSYKATHGFLPSQPNLKTTLLIKGPEIKAGVYLDDISLVDEAPTFAKILGLNWKTDKALSIFKE